MEGQYGFVFSNMKDRVNKKIVTIAIHPGYEQTETDRLIEENEEKEMAEAAGVDEKEIKQLN